MGMLNSPFTFKSYSCVSQGYYGKYFLDKTIALSKHRIENIDLFLWISFDRTTINYHNLSNEFPRRRRGTRSLANSTFTLHRERTLTFCGCDLIGLCEQDKLTIKAQFEKFELNNAFQIFNISYLFSKIERRKIRIESTNSIAVTKISNADSSSTERERERGDI